MPTIFDEQPESAATLSNFSLVVRTIVFTLIVIAVLLSATASVYFYFENEKLNTKLNAVQADLEIIKTAVATKNDKPKISSVEDQLNDIGQKLDELDRDVTAIKNDVGDIQIDVSSIESDVSSIQLKIGY